MITDDNLDNDILKDIINIRCIDSDDYSIQYLDISKDKIKVKQLSGILNDRHKIEIKLDRDQKNNLGDSFYISVISNELNSSIIKHSLNKIKSLAEKNTPIYRGFLSKFKSYIYNLVGKTFIPTENIKNVNEIIELISLYSNKISKETKFGKANFIIVNSKIAAILTGHIGFKHIDNKNINITNHYLYKLGIIVLNNIYVYANPYLDWNDTSILIGRKGNNNELDLQYIYKKDDIKIEDEEFKLKVQSPKYDIIEINDNTKFYYNKINTNIKFSV